MAPAVSLAFDTSAFTAKVERIASKLGTEIATGLYAFGSVVMRDSQDLYVPVDHAILKGSGHVDLPVVSPEGVSVRLSYGGPARAYALAIHEHLSSHSPRSWKAAEAAGRPVQFHQGGPKYLERPVTAHSSELPAVAAGALKSAAA